MRRPRRCRRRRRSPRPRRSPPTTSPPSRSSTWPAPGPPRAAPPRGWRAAATCSPTSRAAWPAGRPWTRCSPRSGPSATTPSDGCDMTSSTLTSPSRATGSRRRRGPKQREALWGTLLAAPATLHTRLWAGVPILLASALSFTSSPAITSARFTGLANYATILSDTLFWRSILHNVVLAAVGIPISMFLALVFAVLLNRTMPAQGLFRVMIFLPHITATVAVAMIWLWIYSPSESGLMNTVLGVIGIGPLPFLTDPDIALPAVILVTIWQGIGLKMLIYLAALQGIDLEMYEAADIDGANFVQKFFRLTIP